MAHTIHDRPVSARPDRHGLRVGQQVQIGPKFGHVVAILKRGLVRVKLATGQCLDVRAGEVMA